MPYSRVAGWHERETPKPPSRKRRAVLNLEVVAVLELRCGRCRTNQGENEKYSVIFFCCVDAVEGKKDVFRRRPKKGLRPESR